MRVALVLGAGGARGYAHLGVLDELRTRGHEVVAISGTSMGALVGGLVAADREQEFREWALTLTQRRLWQLLDPSLSGPGAIRGTKVLAKLGGMLGEHLIEELPIPFTAVATDLRSEREVWFQRGPLTAAIRASVAIPGLLTPVVMGERVLVDGGLLNPVPMEPTLAVDADFTLAVNLTGSDAPAESTSARHEEAELPAGQDSATWLSRVGLGLDRWRTGHGHDLAVTTPNSHVTTLSTMDVMLGSWEAVQAAIARYRMATNPPDVLITVPFRSCKALDFHRAAEMIALGRKLAATALDAAGR